MKSERETPLSLAALVHPDACRCTDAMLVRVAGELVRRGLRVGGVICEKSRYANGARRMDLVDLHRGARIELSQNLGTASAACCMNAQALAEAGPLVRQAVREGVDLVLINRFGQAEVAGAGLVHEFAACAMAQIPVLTAVAARHHDAWCHFTGNLHIELAQNERAVLHWCWQQRQATQPRRGVSPERRRPLPA